MKNLWNKKKAQLAAAGATAFTAFSSNAAIDVSAATTAITTDGTASITAIGGAMLGLAAVAVVFKWAKAAIFG